MGPAVSDAYRQVFTDPVAARAAMDKRRQETLATSASDLAELFAAFLAPADAAVLTAELAGFITATNHEALAAGSQGWWDDIHALVHPWGFELSDISVPVLLLHGRQTSSFPSATANGLPPRSPVDARLLDDDGHLTLQEHRVSQVHSWLKKRQQSRSQAPPAASSTGLRAALPEIGQNLGEVCRPMSPSTGLSAEYAAALKPNCNAQPRARDPSRRPRPLNSRQPTGVPARPEREPWRERRPGRRVGGASGPSGRLDCVKKVLTADLRGG